MSTKKENLSQKALTNLLSLQKKVDRALEKFFLQEWQKAKKIDRTSVQTLEIVKEFTLRGGKRLRPALTYFGYQCFRKEFSSKELVRAAMVNEILQSGLLIHDDIMDQSILRRGRPTAHLLFEELGRKDFNWPKNFPLRKHFGTSLAICAGDLCYALMNKILLESSFANANQAATQLNQTFKEVIYGQIIDARSGFEKNFSWQDVLKIYILKSATYTIEAPLVLGGILAGAPKEKIRAIKKFAFPLGIAFQIQDDILDLFGVSSKTGKEENKDLKEGKKTLLILKTLEKISSEEKIFLEKHLGKANLTAAEIEKIKKIIVSSGALNFCQEYSSKLIVQAKKNIEKQNYLPVGRDFLLGIADYLLMREG